MNAGLAGVSGALIVGGAWCALVGLARIHQPGLRPSSRAMALSARWQRMSSRQRRLLVAGLVVGVAAYALTGWPLLVIVGPLGMWGLPALLADPPNREIELAESLDRWVQLLLGSIPTGKSIPDAIRATRSQAPHDLVEPIGRLVARLDVRWPVADAFGALSDELDSPEADAIIAALILSASRGGLGAMAALKALSETIRCRLTALREIEAERSKPRVVVRQVTGISVAVLGIGMVFGRDFFAPYGTPIGQIILACLLVVYVGALVGLRRMTLPARRDRLLGARSGREVGADA